MNIRRVGVVGCGLMGRGVAEAMATAGFDVVMVKATDGPLDRVESELRTSLDRGVVRGRISAEASREALARIRVTGEMRELLDCDLVVECAAESLAAKTRVLGEIDAVVRPECIIATNTSSLPLSELSHAVAFPARFLGMHFFSPVTAMKLVEIGRTEVTAHDVSEACLRVAAQLGKTPIVLGSAPGYIVNRLLVPTLLMALEMLEEGRARAADIDEAMKLGCGHPMGPLALADVIGLDVVLAMAESFFSELGDRRFRPPPVLRRLVSAGHTGKKASLGVYDYRTADRRENPEVYVSYPSGRTVFPEESSERRLAVG